MKVIVVDPVTIGAVTKIREVEIPSLTIVDGMFVKELNLTPAAYVYKFEHKDEVIKVLNDLDSKRQELKELEGQAWYKILPAYRAK